MTSDLNTLHAVINLHLSMSSWKVTKFVITEGNVAKMVLEWNNGMPHIHPKNAPSP